MGRQPFCCGCRLLQSILRNLSTSAVIDRLKSIFSRHGITEIVKSNNGTHYSSAKFAKFAEDWKFSHVTSSPAYPKSNGLAGNLASNHKILINVTVSMNRNCLSFAKEKVYKNRPVCKNAVT